ncbi:energy transducer TonB [Pelagicoccus sp. SDUM812003]|uniref:energy transducer TonB n=1 Tax=Pelagicoccus sp. SDUM812003 TaxID=3041267 RepID=UPI00280E52B6|nr:energy transducer TonB [Pelagicoccus sp. SDUM812003]MDQ8205208.1 energy transducer TonB [Pelagicoccus sp. SDUM812003]
MTRRHLSFLALAGFLVLGRCLALGEESGKEDEITPPVAIYKVDPTHPTELYARGVEGEAIIIATVDRFGTVLDPIVDRATHEEFGLAAMLAASEWIFDPAVKNGVPIQLKVRIPFEFEISFEHLLNVEMGREVFQELKVPVIPSFELDQAPLPSFVPAFADFYPEAFRNSGKSAAVSVEFIIDPKGNVINPRIISISTPGFEEAAIRAVAHMQYKTIRFEGQPVYVSLMMPIQFSP